MAAIQCQKSVLSGRCYVVSGTPAHDMHHIRPLCLQSNKQLFLAVSTIKACLDVVAVLSGKHFDHVDACSLFHILCADLVKGA